METTGAQGGWGGGRSYMVGGCERGRLWRPCSRPVDPPCTAWLKGLLITCIAAGSSGTGKIMPFMGGGGNQTKDAVKKEAL